MKYGLVASELERDALQVQAKDCTKVVEKLSMELATLKNELNHTQVAFMDAMQEIRAVTAQFNAAQKQIYSIQKLYDNSTYIEEY